LRKGSEIFLRGSANCGRGRKFFPGGSANCGRGRKFFPEVPQFAEGVENFSRRFRKLRKGAMGRWGRCLQAYKTVFQ
jgi:hypothetical protein